MIFAFLAHHYITLRSVSHIKQDDIISRSDSCIARVGHSLSTSRSAAFLVCIIQAYSQFSICLNIFFYFIAMFGPERSAIVQ